MNIRVVKVVAGFFLAGIVSVAWPVLAQAPQDSLPEDLMKTVVLVICGTRQGTGVVTDAQVGFVVTNGHVVIDTETGEQAESCTLGFSSVPGQLPDSYYGGSIEYAVFDEKKDLDFAVIRTLHHISGPTVVFDSFLPTDEFASVGDVVTALGFPQGATALSTISGSITGFSRGTVLTDVGISQGFSGAPVINERQDLVGIATKIRYRIDEESGEEVVLDFGMGDVLSLINWLDSRSPGAHDVYLNHRDEERYHGEPYMIREEDLGCSYVVRTLNSPAVYCLLSGNRRLVFPTEAIFLSWYEDYSEVQFATDELIAEYSLVGAATFRPGTLVKITTDPKVYLVTDSIGSIRWVKTEARAIGLFGEGWAGSVRDVPDSFFVAYSVAAPIP